MWFLKPKILNCVISHPVPIKFVLFPEHNEPHQKIRGHLSKLKFVVQPSGHIQRFQTSPALGQLVTELKGHNKQIYNWKIEHEQDVSLTIGFLRREHSDQSLRRKLQPDHLFIVPLTDDDNAISLLHILHSSQSIQLIYLVFLREFFAAF